MPTIPNYPTLSLTPIAMSNLYTMGVASKYDKRQAVPDGVCLPSEEVCRLRAELILEEAIETINALGFLLCHQSMLDITPELVPLHANDETGQLVDIVDGACDLIYVATAALCACGIPDAPHHLAVCQANDSKFPKGEAIINPATGKYLKPPGWAAPDHQALIDARASVAQQTTLLQISQLLVRERSK